MTEQEEFEKVWLNILIPGEYDSMDDCDKDRWRCAIRQSFDEGWQACADRYEEKITEIMVQSKNQAEDWIAHLKEMQAMVEKLETTAKQQAAELSAWRTNAGCAQPKPWT